jgi:phosphatidylserine/phosphatidylglycerophosphate/cardiolipin synthase-like enzyme
MKKINTLIYYTLFVACYNTAIAQKDIVSKIKVFFNHPVDTTRSTGIKATYITNTLSDTMSAYINRAKYTVDVAQYDYTAYSTSGVGKFATAINNAYTRGVKIRWIYDGSSPNSGLKLLNKYIYTLGSPVGGVYNIMHNKFIIIDVESPDSNDAIVWTGSADWSSYMETGDYNNNLTIQSKQLAIAYTQEFDFMWGDTTHGGSPNTTLSKFGPYKPSVTNHLFNVGGSKVELYFSPTDSVNHQILSHIATANTDIYSAMYAFSEDADANAIVSAKNSGAFAACVLDQYSLSYNSYTILSNYIATNLALYTGTDIYHDKYMIVDPSNPCSDPFVWTGSHNWTGSANTQNDENSIVIHNDTIANQYYQSFAEDFLVISGAPLDTVHFACVLGMAPIENNNIVMNAYPNPFTNKTIITYTLSLTEKVSANVSDIMGRKIATLVDNDIQAAGEHQIEFKGISAGIYLLNIQAGENSLVKKLVQVK